MVAMEKQLRDEIRAKEGIASELKESQISLQKVVSDIIIIKSEKDKGDQEIQTLRKKIATQNEIIESFKVICEGNENIRKFKDALT